MNQTEARIASFYDTIAASGRFMAKDINFWRAEFDLLTRDRPRIFLDLGCGDGREVRLCREAWGSLDAYCGLDLSHGMLQHTKSFAPEARLVQASLSHLPFSSDSLPVVWAAASYLHIGRGQIDAALAELFRVMTPGAHGFISLKNDPLGKDYNQDITTYYGLAEFGRYLKDAGFDVSCKFSDPKRDSRGLVWLGFFFTKPQ